MTISKKIVYAPIFKEFTCKFKRMCRESVTPCGLPPESLLPESLLWSRDSGPKTLNPYSRNPYHLVLSDHVFLLS